MERKNNNAFRKTGAYFRHGVSKDLRRSPGKIVVAFQGVVQRADKFLEVPLEVFLSHSLRNDRKLQIKSCQRVEAHVSNIPNMPFKSALDPLRQRPL